MNKLMIYPAFIVIVLLGCTTKPPRSLRADIVQCTPAQRDQLLWSIAFMRAAAKSEAFRACLLMAVEHGETLFTRQEGRTMGPYFPCLAAPDAPFREPMFVYERRHLGYEAALRVALSQNRLLVRCTNRTDDSAFTLVDHGYGHNRVEEVNMGAAIFTERPAHEKRSRHDGRFSDYDPSYPIDEIAGIILHEMLHTHGFEHGEQESNDCKYATYECASRDAGGDASESCRFNSLNEIAEACMSEIVEASLAWCSFPCPDKTMVPIANYVPSRLGTTSAPPCTCITP